MSQYSIELLNNDELRIRMAMNGRRLIEEHFSWDAIFKELDTITSDIWSKDKERT
jgi:glycosyltransferase involved in cell wall biosynthesis